MGKRNKVLKTGVPKKNLQLLLESKKQSDKSVLNKTKGMMVEDEESEEQSKNTKLNKTTIDLNKSLINEDALKRQSSILGIEESKLREFLENPIKNRRKVTKVVLSRGQRRRLEKRERLKNKTDLGPKLKEKLNQSIMNESAINKTLNMTFNNMSSKPKQDPNNFNLETLENLLDDIMIEKKEVVTPTHIVNPNKSRTSKNSKKLKNLLSQEKERIQKVIHNSSYQSNPDEAMKYHLKNSILQNERK
jgi:hypothetical protein